MWGNRLGWAISAVIATVVISSLTFYARGASTVSPPTLFGFEAADDDLAIAVPAQSVIGELTPCDAAQPYSESLALYRREPNVYDDVAAGTSRTSDLSQLPAIQRLIEGAHCQHMSLFTGDPGRVVQYGEPPDIEALRTIGRAAVRVGLSLQTAKRSADAIRCYEAAFALGAKLYDERLTYREMMVGMELMGEAGVVLSRLTFATGDTARSEAAQKYESARRSTFTSKVQPVAQKLISIDRNVVGRHVGDMFYLAGHAKERMWRVEAILALGRMQYFVGEGGRRADQRGATRHLKQHAMDKDPAIRAAAKAALELTREQMRTLG
ncbi:MAG TPA: hypothetical protein VGR35_10350 [Tepidisphaeraceae bacterium]|nr:hypothetical protein [Tepidisphaeraceae bacterium]